VEVEEAAASMAAAGRGAARQLWPVLFPRGARRGSTAAVWIWGGGTRRGAAAHVMRSRGMAPRAASCCVRWRHRAQEAATYAQLAAAQVLVVERQRLLPLGYNFGY